MPGGVGSAVVGYDTNGGPVYLDADGYAVNGWGAPPAGAQNGIVRVTTDAKGGPPVLGRPVVYQTLPARPTQVDTPDVLGVPVPDDGYPLDLTDDEEAELEYRRRIKTPDAETQAFVKAMQKMNAAGAVSNEVMRQVYEQAMKQVLAQPITYAPSGPIVSPKDYSDLLKVGFPTVDASRTTITYNTSGT